jgi:hypothetical protein
MEHQKLWIRWRRITYCAEEGGPPWWHIGLKVEKIQCPPIEGNQCRQWEWSPFDYMRWQRPWSYHGWAPRSSFRTSLPLDPRNNNQRASFVISLASTDDWEMEDNTEATNNRVAETLIWGGGGGSPSEHQLAFDCQCLATQLGTPKEGMMSTAASFP